MELALNCSAMELSPEPPASATPAQAVRTAGSPAQAVRTAGRFRKDSSPQLGTAERKSARLAANTLTALTAISLVYPGSLLIKFLSFPTV